MKCEYCRFAPVTDAEGFQDECPYFEKYGITWKDGKEGCRLHYKTLQKNEDEYAEYLERTGREMGMMMDAEHEGFQKGFKKGQEKMTEILTEYLQDINPNEIISHLDSGNKATVDWLMRWKEAIMGKIKEEVQND